MNLNVEQRIKIRKFEKIEETLTEILKVSFFTDRGNGEMSKAGALKLSISSSVLVL